MQKTPRLTRFKAELEAEKARLLAELAPYRETYERLINATELTEACREIRKTNSLLATIDNELAALARVDSTTLSMDAESGVYTSR